MSTVTLFGFPRSALVSLAGLVPAASKMLRLLAGAIALIHVTPAAGEPVCRPTLTVTQVQLSEMKLPMLERKWTATVLVDASRCAPNSSGYFELGVLREKENAAVLEFSEEFVWMAPSVKIGIDFWADEAVEHAWINKVTTCPCAR